MTTPPTQPDAQSLAGTPKPKVHTCARCNNDCHADAIDLRAQLTEAREQWRMSSVNRELAAELAAATVKLAQYRKACKWADEQLNTLRQQNEALRREGEVPRLVDACLSMERAYELLVRLRQSHPDENVRIRAWQECSTLDGIGKEITAHIGVSWRPDAARAAQQADGKQGEAK